MIAYSDMVDLVKIGGPIVAFVAVVLVLVFGFIIFTARMVLNWVAQQTQRMEACINRNTEAWAETTGALARLTETINIETKTINDMREDRHGNHAA